MVSKELVKLTKEPLDGIKVFTNDEDVSDIQASIEGPSE
jgi:ubiquitin-conjugating enzyme E2 S